MIQEVTLVRASPVRRFEVTPCFTASAAGQSGVSVTLRRRRAYPGDPPVIGLIFVVRQLGTPGIYPRSMDTRKRNGDPTRPPWVSQLYHIPVPPKALRTQSALPVGLYPSIRQQTSDAAIRLRFHAPARRGACQQSWMRFDCSRSADDGQNIPIVGICVFAPPSRNTQYAL